jgi:23S rRNA (uracil1939-C5)-methyltransferase
MTANTPRLQKGQTVDVEVSTLAFGGKGVARMDDFVIFVTGAVPGDVVRARVTKYKRRYAEARAEVLLTPSPDRRPARCALFGGCGGCVWQNLDYGAQLRYKASQVRESLEHLGGVRDFALLPIVGMADPWRYRNRADFSIATGAEGAVIGFRPPGRWDSVIPLSECHLLPPVIEGVRSTVEAWLRESGLPGWDPRSGCGFARHLLVRSAQRGQEALVSLVTAPEDADDAGGGGLELRPQWAGLVERLRSTHPEVVGVVHAINAGPAELSSGLGGRTLWGRPFLFERVAGIDLKVSIDAFFQTNTLMAHELYTIVAREAGLADGTTESPVIWDLYSGVGSIGLSLAGRASAVLGVEAVPAAVADAEENARLNGIENTHFLEGDTARVLREVAEGHRTLPAQVSHPDVVIVDPPRAGLPKKAVSRIGELRAPRIVYVSCNPTTMAPNVAQLQDYGYRLERVTPVDMFPHTPHVECVALLTLF